MEISWYDPSVGTPIVTVASYGLTFNEGAINELKNPKYVRLGYVKEENCIVVQPLENNETGAIAFAEKRRDKYIRIQNRDFIRFVTRHFDMNLEKSVRIPVYWDVNNGFLIVDIQKAEIGFEDETD